MIDPMRHLIAALATVSLVTAACGGGDDAGDTQPPATETPATDASVTEPTEVPTTAIDAPDATITETTITDTTVVDPPATDVPATDPPATEPPLSIDEPALAEFSPTALGPYAVGVQTITITDVARDRPLTTDVWFPLAESTPGDPHRYTFVTGDFYESPDAISADAVSIAADGPFPLVAFSHGSGGVRYQSSFLTEFLASHGYIVAAPDHTGNTAVDRVIAASAEESGEGDEAAAAQQRQEIALNRVLDIQTVISALLDPESTETVGFVGSIDPERIAVSGHSFGGFTSYAVVSGYDNPLGTAQPDLRIGAIVPLAPAVGDGSPDSLLSDERLASVDVPALVMVGTNDQTTPADPNVDRAFGLGASDPSYRLDLVDAQHQSFSDACDYLAFVPEQENATPAVVAVIEDLASEGCSPGDMPIERVKDITTSFALAFLESVFDDGVMLTPDTVAIPPDVLYASK